jgi:hypothetical protein
MNLLSLASGPPFPLAQDPFGSQGAHSSTNFSASSQFDALSVKIRGYKEAASKAISTEKTGRRCPLEYHHTSAA